MGSIAVRKFLTSDSDAVREIDIATQREYRGSEWDSFTDAEREQMLWYPDGLRGEATAEFSFVATDEAAVVGFLFAFREPFAHRRRLYADGVAVLPEYRRAGVAAALYGELINTAKLAGIEQIQTRISLDNDPSQRLHTSVGFSLVECVEATLDLGSAT